MSPEANRSFRLLPAAWIETTLALAERVSRSLARLGISPNALSVLGLLAGIASGAFYALDRPALAAALIIICGIFDILDGKVAAVSGQRSLFGAVVDSSLDRYSEFFVFLGVAYHLRHGWGVWLTFFAFLGASMVSYTRARAEGLGVDCQVGPMQRAERLLLLVIGTAAGVVFRVLDPALLVAVAVIAAVSHLTAVQRIFHVRRVEQARTSKEI